MKVLSLMQPWASLINFKEKRIETRSWKTNYRGELYIHSSKNIPSTVRNIFWTEPFRSTFRNHDVEDIEKLPLGQIIAKCNLVDCVEILHSSGHQRRARIDSRLYPYISGNEYYFGDYTPGRYAWIFEDIEPLEKLILAKGKLSIWDFDETNLQTLGSLKEE